MLYEIVSVYIIRCLSTNQSSIFKVVGTIHNYIYKKKQSKKESVLKTIILRNNYIYEFIQSFHNINIETLKIKMSELSITYKMNDMNPSMLQERLNYTQRQYEGEQNELKLKLMIQNVFVDNITHSKYKYTHYDYIGNVCFYELKNLTCMYPFVFLGVDKAICENLVIIYTFDNLPTRHFYIKYDTDLFSTFEKIHTKPKNRMYYNEVYNIPKDKLIEFVDTDRIQIPFIEETELRHRLIEKDINDYNKKNNK